MLDICVLTIIIAVSSALFVYWFRSVSVLILRSRATEAYSARVASTIRLQFPAVRQALASGQNIASLDPLWISLEWDYKMLTDLLQHVGGTQSIEKRVLTADYHLMRMWYKLTRVLGVSQARNALAEMVSILDYFAAEVGRQSA